MGNWRTVQIVGTCPQEQVGAVRDALRKDYSGLDFDWNEWGPLCFSPSGSLCGLNDWIAPEMSVVGNLSERDFGVEDVADELRKLVGIAPGLNLAVHCGDDWESDDCIATIVVAGGSVEIEDAQIAKLPGVSDDHMASRLSTMLGGLRIREGNDG